MSRPTESERRRSHVRWGLGALLLVAIGTYLGFTKAIPFRHHYEVRAVFSSAATQLKKNSPVRIAGVNVGKVASVHRGPGTTVLVTMRIDDQGRPIGRDARLEIRPRLFLEGNFFVDVQPGRPGAPELPDGGTVPLAQTAIPVQFDQVLDTFDRDGRRDLQTTTRELARGLAGGGAQALNRTFGDAPKGLTALAATAAAMRGVRPDDLSRFVAGQAAVSRALVADPGALVGLVRGLDATLGALGDRAGAVARTVSLLDVVLRKSDAAQADARAVVGPARRLAAALTPALGPAPTTLRLLNGVLADARPLLAEGALPRLARTLRPATDDLAAQVPDLRDLFSQAQPVAQCLDRNIVATLTRSVDDGRLSTGMPVWQELVRFPVALSSASGNFNGNGAQLRLSVGGGEHTLATQSPSLGELVTATDEALSGARPRYTPGHAPPFRPDVDCRTQDPPDLAAASVPAPASTRHAAPVLATKAVQERVAKALEALRAKARRR
jgi:virulence factor Mce-like protein